MKISIMKSGKDYNLIILGENNVVFFDLLISQEVLNKLARECNKYKTDDIYSEIIINKKK